MKSANILLTNECNFRCSHCSINAGAKNKQFSLKELGALFKNLKGKGFKKVDLSGGEPFLRDDILEIVKLAKKQRFKVKIITNGSLINKNILLKLRKIKLDAIAISLDSLDYKLQIITRPIAQKIFNNVLRNIKEVKKLGFYTKINTVVYRQSLKKLKELIYFCLINKIDELRICYMLPIGRGKGFNEKEILKPKEWLDFVEKNLKYYFVNHHTKIFIGSLIAKREKGYEKVGCLMKNNQNIDISKERMVSCPLMLETKDKKHESCKGLLKNFFGKSYIPKGYIFACPIRKFNLQELI